MRSVYKIMLIILASLLVSCSRAPSFTPNSNFRTGTDGLVLTIEGEDTLTLYDKDAILPEPYLIKVENKGASGVTDIYMYIKLKDDFLTTSEDIVIQSLSEFNDGGSLSILEGKTKYSKKGDLITHTIKLTPKLPPTSGVTSKISVDLCYQYKTIFSDSICVGKDCDKSSYSYSGQGAPIKVANVEVKNIPDGEEIKPVVIVSFENSKGNPFSLPEKFKEACTSLSEINNLTITQARLGAVELSCKGRKIRLSDAEKEISCEMKGSIPGNQRFDTALAIELAYGYSEKIVKEINIRRESFEE